jgi:deoxyribodipyrimidine photolyase-related protein
LKKSRSLRLVLGDQLTKQLSSLTDLDPENNQEQDIVLICEVTEEATYVTHHRQKLALLFSAMRHFAAELQDEGINVDYISLNSPGNTGSFTGEVKRALKKHGCSKLIVTEPGEWRVLQMFESWQDNLDATIEIRPDSRFLCSIAEFKQWADTQKQLRMENFYRYMRKQTGWLMQNGKPVGGKWNYDQSNRKPLATSINLPERAIPAIDDVTRDVIKMVTEKFPDNPGELDTFHWAVNREQALTVLGDFIQQQLIHFGPYQDAMKTDEDFLFHAIISPYINIGLLSPREVCEAVLQAGENNDLPIETVEGFIRQILGWREYVRGIYWLKMPGYAETNTFAADRSLPEFFWNAETEMFCLKQSIQSTMRNAYAHHIQRLMVIGNFSLLTGLSPKAVEEWYLSVYADAFEWVELPNTHGMVLYADQGLLASKPYAASGAYINRMSDYCKNCHYSVKEKNGKNACPFNYLYWYFLDRNRDKLEKNQRLAMPYRTLAKMAEEKRSKIKQDAEAFLAELN